MESSLSMEACRALTQLARQMLETNKPTTQTHVLAKGRVYRMVVSLERVPTEQLHDVFIRYF